MKKVYPKVVLSLLLMCMLRLAQAQQLFINEIHYDNDGGDVNEGIELAGTAGLDLSGYSLILYNGNNGLVYNAEILTGVVPNHQNNFGTVFFAISGLQNGSPDGVALVSGDSVLQFLSYEGSFTAIGGAADGLLSEDIGVEESPSTLVNTSLQLTGTGLAFNDFIWVADSSTYDFPNSGQFFELDTTSTGVDTVIIEPNVAFVFINEIHYDNNGSDIGEGIEVAGSSGTDLVDYSVVLYNGNNGSVYNTIALSGIFNNLEAGFGTLSFPVSGIQNGSPDGLALIDDSGTVIQFLSYEGSFVAVGGPADGMTSEDIGVFEDGSTAIGESLQLTGEGNQYEDFIWTAPMSNSFDQINTDQVFLPVKDIVFINEIHYDNNGSDVGEGVEIAGIAGTDLSDYALVFYNGNNGTAYNTVALSGITPDQDDGYGTLSFQVSGIQNGAPDGIALVKDTVLVQFLSYEGAFTAVGGVADGVISEDIGVVESGGTPAGHSLQLVGIGKSYEDFFWAEAMINTFGTVNAGQSFGDSVIVIPPDSLVLSSISEARAFPLGTEVQIQGVLTVSSQFGGPAYIQDSTAGISIFAQEIHGEGAFQIGDEIEVTGSLGEFGQMIQIENVTIVDSVSSGNTVVPDTVLISDLGAYEGRLVLIENITFDNTTGLLYPNSNHQISDNSGTVQLRIDADVSSLIGKLKPQVSTYVTGVVGSFEGTLQILPRFEADLPDAEDFVPVGADLSKDSTFDVVSWNMEFFGTTLENFGPSNIGLQRNNARLVLQSLEADILAVQEVSEEDVLDQLLDSTRYDKVCSDVYSRSFQPSDGTFPPQKLCYIYDTTTVHIINEKVIFNDFYTDARTGLTTDLDDYPTGSASSFWASGRLPYMVSALVNILGVQDTINLVNIHAKSGGASGDVARKAYDLLALKDTLDTHYASDKVIVLGDYNDDVDISIGGGVTPYLPLVSDEDNYKVVTESLSLTGFRSFLFADNMIDHLTITDEMFDEYIDGSETTFIPFNLIDNYANTTSDHLPVMGRFKFEAPFDPLVLTLIDSVAVYDGYEALATVIVNAEITGGLSPYAFDWSNGDFDSTAEIGSEFEVVYLSVTDQNGITVRDSIAVTVNDVSCYRGRGYVGVEMCYTGRKSICVPEYLVEHFLDKGYTLGACEEYYEPRRVVRAWPNPFYRFLKLGFDFDEETVVNLVVYNRRGQKVLNTQESIPVGFSSRSYYFGNKRRGFYYLKVTSPDDPDYLESIKLFKK